MGGNTQLRTQTWELRVLSVPSEGSALITVGYRGIMSCPFTPRVLPTALWVNTARACAWLCVLSLWPPTVGCSVGICDLQGEILGVTLVLQTCLSLMHWTNTVVGSGNTTETLTKVCVPGELADMPGSERSLGHWGQGSETNDHGTLQRSQGQSLS